MSKLEISQEDADKILNDSTNGMTPEKTREICARSGDAVILATKSGPLKKFVSHIALMGKMLTFFCTGRYKDAPWRTIAGIAGTLGYVLSPIDMIPDVIPFIGFLDDAAVVGVALKLISRDLKVFEMWLNAHNAEQMQEGK